MISFAERQLLAELVIEAGSDKTIPPWNYLVPLPMDMKMRLASELFADVVVDTDRVSPAC